MLRHRTLSPTIYLTEVTDQALRLIANIPPTQRRKSAVLAKKNAPSRSDFSVSTYVVLKTRHANPNIHVRRFIVHVRSPNLSATRPQLLSLRGAATYYGFASHTTTHLPPTPIVVCTPPRHSKVKTQASKLEEGYPSSFSTARGGISLRGGRKGEAKEANINLYWSVSEPLLVNAPTTIGQKTNHY